MMEGVVRSPSAFSITRAFPPSSTATQELVVPRSIPIILPIVFSPSRQSGWRCLERSVSLNSVVLCVHPRDRCRPVRHGHGLLYWRSHDDFKSHDYIEPSVADQPECMLVSLGYHYHGRSQYPAVQAISLLHHRNHRIGFRIRALLYPHRLMQLWVEGLAQRIDLLDAELAQAIQEAFQCKLHAFLQPFHRVIIRINGYLQGPFKIVDDREQLGGHTLLPELVGLLDILLRAATQVLHLSLHPQYFVLLLQYQRLCLGQSGQGIMQGVVCPFRSGLGLLHALLQLQIILWSLILLLYVLTHVLTLKASLMNFQPIWGRTRTIQPTAMNKSPKISSSTDNLPLHRLYFTIIGARKG